MTVHLHDYGEVGVGAGGAPINYSEVSRLILASRHLEPARHDFHALVAGDGAATLRRLVRPGDTLVCTAGPWAHFYHHWREQAGLDFRIVRDARTTAWSPYLAQEWLAAPLLRAGDSLILPSAFARAFYQQLFPHLAGAAVAVLYPMAAHLPAAAAAKARHAGPVRIGCLGRIADDKNVAAAFDLVARLNASQPAELHLAGAFYPRSATLGSARDLAAEAARRGLAAGTVCYHGDLPYGDIWRFLGQLDVLYFPAVSSNESFGRVLVEAGRAGVPVIATDYAAAGELVPRANLVPVRYRQLDDQPLTRPLALGEPDTAAAVRILAAGPAPADPLGDARFSGDAFLNLVSHGEMPATCAWAPTSGVARFLGGLRISGLVPPDRQAAAALCERQIRFLRALHDRRPARRLAALARVARYLPGHPLLRRVARERLFNAAPPGVLRTGIAAALAIGFDPRLNLSAPEPAP